MVLVVGALEAHLGAVSVHLAVVHPLHGLVDPDVGFRVQGLGLGFRV